MKKKEKHVVSVEIVGYKNHAETIAHELAILLNDELMPWKRQVKSLKIKRNGRDFKRVA
tara:strand:+ start:666 stop:842 length:177 start_codon:yes stop_codon:yes gene_type:complete